MTSVAKWTIRLEYSIEQGEEPETLELAISGSNRTDGGKRPVNETIAGDMARLCLMLAVSEMTVRASSLEETAEMFEEVILKDGEDHLQRTRSSE